MVRKFSLPDGRVLVGVVGGWVGGLGKGVGGLVGGVVDGLVRLLLGLLRRFPFVGKVGKGRWEEE